MKKITLLLALVCSMSLFATRYLVQTGAPGAATWRAAGGGEVLVDLTVNGQTLNAWYNALTATSGDEVWVIKGTYVTTGVTTMKAGVSIYGGFSGTENSLGDRAKMVDGRPWEFVNITTIDGGNTFKGFASSDLASDTYIDGLTITKCRAAVGAGAEIRKKTIIRNCILTKNEANGNTANDAGGGVRVIGGSVIDSYIYDNLSSTGGAGGIGIQSTSLIKGCTIEKNSVTTAGKGGGGLNIATSGGAMLEDNTIINNTAETGAGFNSYLASASTAITIRNTQILNNTATANGGGLFLNISSTNISFENCTFKGNVVTGTTGSGFNGGGMRINAATIELKNCIITDNNSVGNGAAIYSQSTSPVSIYNCLIYNNSNDKAAIHLQNNPTININNTTIASNKGNVIYFATANMTNSTLKNVLFYNNQNPISFVSSTNYPSVIYSAFDTDVSGQPYFGEGCITTVTSNNTFIQSTSFQGIHTNATDSTAIVNANWQLLYDTPVLNAGTTEAATIVDFLGTTRPQGPAYDIGAYELQYFNTTVTFNEGGTVNALTSGDILSEPKGKPLAFNITPTGGQKIASVKYNDVEVKEDIVEGVYTAPALTANATLVVEFSPTTSVTAINKDLTIYSNGNLIELRGLATGDEIIVFSVTGARLFNSKAVNADLSVPVSRGIYVVKVADKVQKVVVD